jgi:hypothetical protein
LWRRAADQLRNTPTGGEMPGSAAWVWEAQAVTVIAHAQHGRLDLVEEITGELPDALSSRLTNAGAGSAALSGDFPICGALLLAVAMMDLDRGERTGDTRATRAGARMIALAERFRYVRGFQPTMSVARARQIAERADKPAYADAVSSYADLGRDGLRAVAEAALRARAQLTVPGPS